MLQVLVHRNVWLTACYLNARIIALDYNIQPLLMPLRLGAPDRTRPGRGTR
jgi:hypothetical protein